MRFLKKKIETATKARNDAIKAEQKLQKSVSSKLQSSPLSSPSSPNTKKRTRIEGYYFTSEASRATKNIVKNYGKAICKFITSPLASPYLDNFLEKEKEKVKSRGFISFVNNSKPLIDGLHNFRSVLLEDENDGKETAAYKKIFKDLSEVFIKYFSVNWIFDSKVVHKDAHLKFRFKILRRIRCPEKFTYLKDSKEKSKKSKVRRT